MVMVCCSCLLSECAVAAAQVMVCFGVEDTAEAMRLGQEAAAMVSQTFTKPIKLEFEKVRAWCGCGCGG